MKIFFIILFVSFPVFSFENCSNGNIKLLEKCTSNNYKSEDIELNYLYKKIINNYPQIKEKVKATQILWVKAKEAICNYTESDGEEFNVYHNVCEYQQTSERNRELKAIILKQSSEVSSSHSNENIEWRNYIRSHCSFMNENYSDTGCEERNIFLHMSE